MIVSKTQSNYVETPHCEETEMNGNKHFSIVVIIHFFLHYAFLHKPRVTSNYP